MLRRKAATSGQPIDRVIGAEFAESVLADDFKTAHGLLSSNLQRQISIDQLSWLYREAKKRFGAPKRFDNGLAPGTVQDTLLKRGAGVTALDDPLVKAARRGGHIRFWSDTSENSGRLVFFCNYITVEEDGRIVIGDVGFGTYSDTVVLRPEEER